MYGIVEWINGNPVLDGIRCFKTRERAVEHSRELERLTNNMPLDVSYTIIEITEEDN